MISGLRDPNGVHRDLAAQLSRKPERHEAHAEFGDGIAGRAGKPLLLHVERRRVHQDVRILRLRKMRDGVATPRWRC
jgi:hypothetical protein